MPDDVSPPGATRLTLVANPNQRAVNEAALVLTAMHIDHEVVFDAGQWRLLVDADTAAAARYQLDAYRRENAPTASRAVPAQLIDDGWLGVLGFLGVIWLVPAMGHWSTLDFHALGHLDAGAVQHGEWWRVVTALTLHADIAHILSNSVFGCLFGLFVGRYLGSGLGWLMVLVSASLANLCNALLQPEAFKSIGASTATFAALGLVPAYGWRRGFFRGPGKRREFAPVFAAIAMLAFTGFGSERVDVMGHLLGFGAGLCTGLLSARVARLDPTTTRRPDQQRAGLAAVIVLAAAWLAAL